jgi:hypothetical protein
MDQSLSPLFDRVVGGILALLLWIAITRLLQSYRARDQNRILLPVAVANGVLLTIGVSPVGLLASELVQYTPAISLKVAHLIQGILDVSVVLSILFGLGTMLEKSGIIGGVSFAVGFLGGFLLIYSPVAGILLIMGAIGVEEYAPAKW